MPVPTAIGDLSQTAGSNSPAGTESPITADNYFRAHAAFIAQLQAEKAPIADPTFTGVVTTAGKVKFPGTQSASSDVNTLDDYEEGTWTPTDGSGAGLTLSGFTGTYTKIGNRCFVSLQGLFPTTVDTSNALISSLPFACEPIITAYGHAAGMAGIMNVAAPYLVRIVGAGGTDLRFYLSTSASTVATNADLSAKLIFLNFHYRTAT